MAIASYTFPVFGNLCLCGCGSGIDSRGISYTFHKLHVIFVIEAFERVFEFMILRKRQLATPQPSIPHSCFYPVLVHVGQGARRCVHETVDVQLTIKILSGVWHFSVDRLLRSSGCEILTLWPWKWTFK